MIRRAIAALLAIACVAWLVVYWVWIPGAFWYATPGTLIIAYAIIKTVLDDMPYNGYPG